MTSSLSVLDDGIQGEAAGLDRLLHTGEFA
jgi:hypothetical protein